MRKVLPWVGLGLLAATLAGTGFGCSSSSSNGGTGGSGGGKCVGVCQDGGGTGGSGTGGTGTGGTGTGGSGTGGTTSSGLGKACATNTDCDSGMTCITPDTPGNINGGGPGGGYCTKSCTANTDCQAIDPKATCVNLGTQAAPAAYCLEGCTPGGSTSSADPNKCHGRINDGSGPVACAGLYNVGADGGLVNPDAGPSSYACEPFCGSDADCGDKKCDLSTGFCDSSPKTGAPIGTPCNPQQARNGGTDPCAGVCIGDNPSDPTKGECSALCIVGSVGCGAQPGIKPSAACLFVFSQSAGIGDLGACGQLCDCNSDCLNSGDICISGGATFQGAYSRAGYCAPPQADSGAGIAQCPGGGGAGGSGGSGAGGAPADAGNGG